MCRSADEAAFSQSVNELGHLVVGVAFIKGFLGAFLFLVSGFDGYVANSEGPTSVVGVLGRPLARR